MTSNAFHSAFTDAGIPARFHDASLAGLQEAKRLVAPDLMAYVQANYATDLKSGRGVFLDGEDDLCETVMYCLAKSAMVRKVTSLVITISDVATLLDPDLDEDLYDDLERLRGATALYIPQFNDVSYDTNPLSPRERYRVEQFLISRIDNGRAVSVHYTAGGPKEWWSSRLLKRLHNTTTRFTL